LLWQGLYYFSKDSPPVSSPHPARVLVCFGAIASDEMTHLIPRPMFTPKRFEYTVLWCQFTERWDGGKLLGVGLVIVFVLCSNCSRPRPQGVIPNEGTPHPLWSRGGGCPQAPISIHTRTRIRTPSRTRTLRPGPPASWPLEPATIAQPRPSGVQHWEYFLYICVCGGGGRVRGCP